MTGLRLTPSLPLPTVRHAAVRPTSTPAAITTAEADQIADAFPARPSVAQKLYGAGRQVTQSVPLGGRLDLSA